MLEARGAVANKLGELLLSLNLNLVERQDHRMIIINAVTSAGCFVETQHSAQPKGDGASQGKLHLS